MKHKRAAKKQAAMRKRKKKIAQKLRKQLAALKKKFNTYVLKANKTKNKTKEKTYFKRAKKLEVKIGAVEKKREQL